MPAISIIVPVYRVEKYLPRCVDSILCQTFEDFELLLINDGSPDRCGELCEQYAKVDSRVRVIHKQNGGLSDARNTGVAASRAGLVAFVDGDDCIKPDMYEVLYRQLTGERADISVCGIIDCYPNGECSLRCKEGEKLVLNDKEAIRLILQGEKFSVNATNKLFRKELFSQLPFPIGRHSEDAFIMVELFSRAKRVVFTTDAKYCYMHRKNSLTTSPFQVEDFDTVEAYSDNLAFIRLYYPDLTELAVFRYLWSYFYLLEKMAFSENLSQQGALKEVAHVLRRHTLTVLKNPYFTKKRKLSALLLLFSKRLFLAVTRRKKAGALHRVRKEDA